MNRPAQTTLAHLNVLAMKDMNLMKMDLHVEVVMFDTRFLVSAVLKSSRDGAVTFKNCYYLITFSATFKPDSFKSLQCNEAVFSSFANFISRRRRMQVGHN